MKPQTQLWAKFESKGKPAATRVVNGSVAELIRAQAEWILEVYMGAYIRVTYARTESELTELTQSARSATRAGMLADINEMFAEIDNEQES